MRWLLPLLMACGDKEPASDAEDTDVEGDADADTDADTDSVVDADTDTDVGDTDVPVEPVGGCAVDRWDPATFSTVIDVGPGYGAATPSDVPWESLGAGTLVRIWSNGSAYHDKWSIDSVGTAAEPIVVIGVCDPVTGALPVIDGADAKTRLQLDYWSETRTVIKIGGTSTGPDVPAHIFVEDLEIRGGRSSNRFTDEGGAAATYDDNAAAIFVEEAEHLTIRGCTLADSGNGLFVAHESSDLLISSNDIWGNGNVGSAYEHNSYTEALGIVFEYNRYGALCAGCSGNNLKDRSAGTIVRYNWIEGGNRQLDLVESEFPAIAGDPSYGETFVYGNVLVEPDGDGNSQIVHYGGDNGDVGTYRRGTLYFYDNTVVSERAGNTTLVRLSDPDETLDMRNTIVSAAKLAILERDGTATLATSWLPTGWVDSFDGGFAGTVTDSGVITGGDPGFVDAAGQDYALAAGSPAIGAAGPLAPAALPVDMQYVPHQQGTARITTNDLGAFEP